MTVEEKNKLYRKIIINNRKDQDTKGWLIDFGLSKQTEKSFCGTNFVYPPHTVGIIETVDGRCLLVEVENFTYND